MKDIFERPAVFYGARTKKGFNLVLEILQFAAVFIVAGIAEGIIAGLVYLIIFLNNPTIMGMLRGLSVRSSDYMDNVNQFVQYLTKGDLFHVVMLLLTGLMILIVLLFCKFIQRRRMTSVGFRKKGMIKEYVIGSAVGLGIFSIAVAIGVATGSVSITGYALNGAWLGLIFIFIGYMIQGMSEEVLMRGYFMVSISRRYPLWVAILTNSIVFAMLHLGNAGIAPLAFFNLFLFGVFESIYFIKRGNIWGIAGVHSLWNFAQGNLYGISVSGQSSGSSILSSKFTSGYELFNGGSFGLEGGLCVTIVLVVGIVVLYFIKGKVDQDEIEQEIKMVDQDRAKFAARDYESKQRQIEQFPYMANKDGNMPMNQQMYQNPQNQNYQNYQNNQNYQSPNPAQRINDLGQSDHTQNPNNQGM